MSDSCLPPGITAPVLAAMEPRQLFVFFAGLTLVFFVLRSHRRKSRSATEKAITRFEARRHRTTQEAIAEYDSEALLRCDCYLREAQGGIRSLMALLQSSFRRAGGTVQAEGTVVELEGASGGPDATLLSCKATALTRELLRAQAAELTGEGRTPQEAAALLGCTAGEVELALLAGRQHPATGPSRDVLSERRATSTSTS